MRKFYTILSDTLKSGGSVQLLTALSGMEDGIALLAQKALCCEGRIIAQEERLLPFWERQFSQTQGKSRPFLVTDGEVKILWEQISSRPQLIICGGGHIAQPLASLGTMLDFDVTVLDDRIEFANPGRFPSANRVICVPFAQALEQFSYTDSTYFVIVTRGHADDRLCLEHILRRTFGYVGMIGSRRKVEVVMREMERQGYEKALLDQVHAPIGLRIGAQTPAEIAVCIAAEMIQVHSGAANGAFDPLALEQLALGEPMLLATIIEKRGSAPRALGAKMMIERSGRLYGSIGGGRAEADVAAMAHTVMEKGAPCVVQCDMTNNDARQAGMVCGGSISVLLEPIG